jgi:UrcA family protein
LPDNQETIVNITSTNLTRVIQTAILGAFALSCAAASNAADYGNVPTAVVKFGDLNPSNPQGAAKLYGRIVAAAQEVCKPFDVRSDDLGAQSRLHACVSKAIANGVSKVGKTELFAIYNAKNHQSLPVSVIAVR